MTGSTHKKVHVERFDRETLKGYVNPQTWLGTSGMELMSLAGTVAVVPYEEVKVVGFVRDLEGEGFAREKRLFTSRPKTEGLWLRLLFKDGDVLDGLLANNLLQLSAYGFMVAPPDPASNSQRIFVPRTALADAKVLGVIGSPLKRRKRPPAAEGQIKLFE